MDSVGLAGGDRTDGECVDAVAHERRDGIINESVALDHRPPGEPLGHDAHTIVAAFARTGVTGMGSTVIDDVDLRGREGLLERRSELPAAFVVQRHVQALAAELVRRKSQKSCPATNASVRIVRPNTLKLTHVRSLAWKATARFSPPSTA